jgi:hypothetical protein
VLCLDFQVRSVWNSGLTRLFARENASYELNGFFPRRQGGAWKVGWVELRSRTEVGVEDRRQAVTHTMYYPCWLFRSFNCIVASAVFGRWPWCENEGRKRKETIKFSPLLLFLSIPSIPCSKLLISDSLRGSNSNISEVKNACAGYAAYAVNCVY